MCHSVLLQPTVASSHSTFGPTDPYVFLSLLYSVFRNGDERFRGARVLLPRRIMASWEHVLELVLQTLLAMSSMYVCMMLNLLVLC